MFRLTLLLFQQMYVTVPMMLYPVLFIGLTMPAVRVQRQFFLYEAAATTPSTMMNSKFQNKYLKIAMLSERIDILINLSRQTL